MERRNELEWRSNEWEWSKWAGALSGWRVGASPSVFRLVSRETRSGEVGGADLPRPSDHWALT